MVTKNQTRSYLNEISPQISGADPLGPLAMHATSSFRFVDVFRGQFKKGTWERDDSSAEKCAVPTRWSQGFRTFYLLERDSVMSCTTNTPKTDVSKLWWLLCPGTRIGPSVTQARPCSLCPFCPQPLPPVLPSPRVSLTSPLTYSYSPEITFTVYENWCLCSSSSDRSPSSVSLGEFLCF